jgi:hypothetical protein
MPYLEATLALAEISIGYVIVICHNFLHRFADLIADFRSYESKSAKLSTYTEEAHRQIDLIIEAIPVDKDKFSTPIGKAILQYENITDFLLGYEYGHVAEACALSRANQEKSDRNRNETLAL